jgi:predicted transcriptional regulator
MPIETVLSMRVEMCRPEDTLAEVAQKMSERGIGSLPVVTDDGSVVSTITDLDIAIAASIEGRKLIDLTVREAMSRELGVGTGTVTPMDPRAPSSPRRASSRRSRPARGRPELPD